MRYLVIYDITDDNLRNHVSELLKDYGLQRIQYSAFIGSLRRDRLNSLTADLRRLIGEAVENVQIYPLCDLCFNGRREIGKPKRYELVEEKRKVVYF
ncbi:MAG: CRISPR-associated endonuclease Cas2 [Candidatus Bathyarchaeota archaeon]|nr:CRISPR-associated endonuclease Cas2 [Candidatus Bathyarchaeota archaeon]